MMADEHDNNSASGAQEATEINPFASGYPEQAGTARGPLPDWQAADQPLPDLPVMEQLPDPDALPDPGYPADAGDAAAGIAAAARASAMAVGVGVAAADQPPVPTGTACCDANRLDAARLDTARLNAAGRHGAFERARQARSARPGATAGEVLWRRGGASAAPATAAGAAPFAAVAA